MKLNIFLSSGKFILKTVVLVISIWSSSYSFAQNFGHIKTFGYDYLNFSNDLTQADWIARKHDWLIGPQTGNLTFDGNRVSLSVYNAVKNANPDTKIMVYSPYHTVLPHMMERLEAWCIQNNRNPEDLYYHYYFDTTINTTQGLRTVPGYGGGSATNLSEARVRAKWWGGQYPNVNPSSQTFRDAFSAMTIEQITYIGSANVYADGLYLDTFTGTTDSGYWSNHLENTIEMRTLGLTTETLALAKARQDLRDAFIQLRNDLITATGNNSFVLLPNGDSAGEMYIWAADVYETYKNDFNELAVEFLVGSATNSNLIPDLRRLYDDLESGRKLWFRSQTNYDTNIPYGFTSFILATHYLINHDNALFFYHEGSAANYGGTPFGDLRTSHWHQNMEVNIGQPINRAGNDYWGVPNTNRFFVFAEGPNYTIVGREYSNALVLAKFGNTGGFSNIGSNPTTHTLPSQYHQLLDDNSLGTLTSTITLGNSEGVILIKSANTSIPPTPTNVTISYEITP